jgi:hypothetical protein
MHRRVAASFVLTAALVVAACNDDGRTLRPARPNQTESVSTPAPVTTAAPTTEPPSTEPANTVGALTAPWANGAAIPAKYTCDGANQSPPLSWTTAPEGTVEIAVSVLDLDKPDFVHWAVSGIDASATSLDAGMVPEFAVVATNSSDTQGYAGPCPPAGSTHRYQFTVYFLTQPTELADGVAGVDLLTFVEAAALSSLSVSGVYSR